ncbi:hypothetical protein NT239_10825 [Chitinibacter sp. SCUT-21]|uniref:hypothetical protein n=1 Tax=Chitinibacter sp. SCUT-21 TaxID=2970891 RepID=UPI0035A6DF40
MSIVTRLASPPEYRKLASWFKEAGKAEPTLADMVLLAEEAESLCGALRVVMARGLIRIDSVIARDDEVLAMLLQQSARWVGREKCWVLASNAALPVYLAAGFVQQEIAEDTLRQEAEVKGMHVLAREAESQADATEEIAQAASGGSALAAD